MYTREYLSIGNMMTDQQKDNLSHPITYITYSQTEDYKENTVKISNDILDTLEYNSYREQIIEHYQALKLISDEVHTRIDGFDSNIPNVQKHIAKLMPLFAKQQEHGQWLDILTESDDTEKALKQLRYGIQKYEFLNGANIHVYIDTIKNVVLTENEINNRRLPIERSKVIKAITSLSEKIENDFEDISFNKKPFLISTPVSGASVIQENLFSPDTIDTQVVLEKMMERNQAYDNYKPYEKYNKDYKGVRDLAMSHRNTGEIAEFIIRLLTSYPYFTYDQSYYKQIKESNKQKNNNEETPIFYIGQNSQLY